MERGDLILAVGLPGLALTVGSLARGRAVSRARLAERLVAADAAGRDGARRAASAERRRIAAEIQALVVGDVEAIADEVGRARRAEAAGDAVALGSALVEVNETAAATLEALRRLLDAVDSGAPRPDRPIVVENGVDGADPPGLIERGDRRLTPPGARLTAGRLASDVLSPDLSARTVLVHRPHGLELRITGRGRRPTALTDPGSLVALRERVRLLGGSVTAASRLRGWRLRASLPTGSAGAETAGRLPLSPGAADALLALGVAGIVLVDVAVFPVERPRLSMLMGTASAAVPLAVRRRAPLLASFSAAAGLVAGAALGALPTGPAPPYFEITIIPFAAGAHATSATQALAGAAVTTAGAVLAVLPQLGEEGWPRHRDLLVMAAWGVLMGALTWYARRHHAGALALAIGEEELAIRHPMLVRSAVEEERRRVARDLHDVVSHGVTLCGVLAGGAAARLRGGPHGPVDDTIAALEDAIALTRVEVERLVRALELPAAGPHPGSGLESLPALVGGAGPHAELRLDVPEGRSVPQAVGGCVYRVVQEALTNAHRHAGSPSVRVEVRVGESEARVEVISGPARRPSPGTGTGRGLAGIRDRAASLGGQAEAGPTGDGGFRIAARLPLPPAPG